jgi:hypothetical protein
MKTEWHYRGIVLASIGYFMKNIRLSVHIPETLTEKEEKP